MKTITFMCNKLARDKVAETMRQTGITTKHRQVTPDELRALLSQKLLEEATEVTQATNREDIISELADVCEVIDGLKKAHAIASEEIAVIQATKRQKRGGFEQGVFLESITLAENNEWTQIFRASPDRYIEKK